MRAMLGTFKRSPELARCDKHCTPHSFTRANGPSMLHDHSVCFLRVTTMMHAPCDSTAGDTQVLPRTSQALHKLHLPQNLVCPCLEPPVGLPPSKAGPTPHTRSPASIQAVGEPSCVTGWALPLHSHSCVALGDNPFIPLTIHEWK